MNSLAVMLVLIFMGCDGQGLMRTIHRDKCFVRRKIKKQKITRIFIFSAHLSGKIKNLQSRMFHYVYNYHQFQSSDIDIFTCDVRVYRDSSDLPFQTTQTTVLGWIALLHYL